MNTQIEIKRLNENAKIPTYGTEYSAGADIYALVEGESVIIKPGESKMISTGLAFAIPEGFVGLIVARSSLGTKRGLAPANKVGVIDSDYRGEVRVVLHNHGCESQMVENGERIAQILFVPYYAANFKVVDELDTTVRGVGGFGSTGAK